jgi:carbonic anhydrase/acetyltransferase-like protein (isoleucine patch superfamily)
MANLVKLGLYHLQTFGIVATIIRACEFIKNRYQSSYYTQRVATTADTVGDLTVNGPSSVSEQTTLGNNVNFNGLRVRGDGELIIGDNFHSGPGILILTRNHNYDEGDAIPYDDTYNRHSVEIQDNVWLGARVTIIPGVTIGEGAIIQAGSTVTQDIPEGAIAGGHPAEVFDYRDMDHYKRLKKEEKFH